MKERIGWVMTVLAVLLTSGSLWAHHSLTAGFDTAKTLTLKGTLTKVAWTNPHIELSLDVKNEGGGMEVWRLVGAPPFFFRERNISKERFQQVLGQILTAEMYGAKDRTRLGVVLKIIFPDGTSVKIVPDA